MRPFHTLIITIVYFATAMSQVLFADLNGKALQLFCLQKFIQNFTNKKDIFILLNNLTDHIKTKQIGSASLFRWHKISTIDIYWFVLTFFSIESTEIFLYCLFFKNWIFEGFFSYSTH